jgi:Met-zincin
VYTPVKKTIQLRALDWMDKQVLQTPGWLLDKDILQRIEPMGATERMRQLQGSAIAQLFEKERLKRLDEAEALHGAEQVFTLLDLFSGTKDAVFSELRSGAEIDPFRKNVQRVFIDRMEALMKDNNNDFDLTGVKAITRGTLKNLQAEMAAAAGRQKDTADKYHLEDLVERIRGVLEPVGIGAAGSKVESFE